MSFGSSGFGGGGFGSTNNNTSSGFGGGTFGSTNNAPGFGQQNTTGFGSNANNTTSGFGGGTFGTSNSGFGASKPAFGSAASTSSSLFGSNTATAGSGFGSGGFGANNNTANTSGFGGGNTGTTSLFGQSKPASGFGGSGSGNLFGGSTAVGSGFGSTNNNASSGGAFGSGAIGTALGGPVPESQGTANPQYEPFREKEGTTNMNNYFQSINFQAPYQKYSFEELRLGDYNAGRRTANAGGQAGAFGASTGFGGFGGQNNQSQGTGFGNTAGSGGLFGTTNNTSGAGFGANTSTAGGFGSSFGQKPAAGGLFGSTAATTQPSGGAFGSAGASGFGQQNNSTFGNTQGAGGLFGQSNQQKPGGAFGSTTTGNAFGAGATATSGFGNSGGLFGQQNQNQAQNSSPFGGNQQQQNPSNTFGQTSTGAGFGSFGNNANNQQKPSLFGNTNNNTSSVFGNQTQNNQQPAGGLFGNTNNTGNNGAFGNANNQQQAGGLFAPKPAAGGLFGNTQPNQQNAGNSVFGQQPNQQGQAASLFGSTAQKPLGNTAGGLFGSTNQQPANNSLFSNTLTNPNQGSLLGNSLLGNQNNLQPPQGLSASINDPNPYGSVSIFNGLPPPPQTNPGPIATPIQAGHKQRKPAVLPQYRLNPAMSPRFATPQRRGYGFSYSTYGTPTSAMSTPGGFSSSLLGGSISRGLGKSFSTSNLRKTYDSDADSILAPGAFSASSSRFSNQGSLKKLTINRTLRSDLFGSNSLAALPSPETDDTQNQSSIRKKVSFDSAAGGNVNGHQSFNGFAEASGALPNGTTNGELTPTPTAEEQGYLRSSRTNLFSNKVNNGRRSLGSLQPEMSQAKGKELAIVHEDDPADASNNNAVTLGLPDRSDPEPGNYWCKPTISELKRLTPQQLKRFEGFQIGRVGCAQCRFLEPVDLTVVDFNKLFGEIAEITTRSCTIYPTNAGKPPVGGGLNVPSEITMENSWPRARNRQDVLYETSGPAFDKHIIRLRRAKGTKYVKYDKAQGVWTFRVPHFTTYALDYEDDESEADLLDSSALSAVSKDPPTPTPLAKKSRAGSTPGPSRSKPTNSSMVDDSFARASSELEDTFEFKKPRIPGGFDEIPAFDDHDVEIEDVQENGKPFLGGRSAALPTDDEDEPSEVQVDKDDGGQALVVRDNDAVEDVVMDMVGSFPDEGAHRATLRASKNDQATPRKPKLILEDDWAQQLQRTVSPRKRDRQALKESQAALFNDADFNMSASQVTKKLTADAGEITNSIDLMKSLFGKEEMRKSVNVVGKQVVRKGFEWPYPKQPSTEQPEMNEVELEFHNSLKPTWGPENILVHAAHDGMAPPAQDLLKLPMNIIRSLSSENRDIHLSKFAPQELSWRGYERQLQRSEILLEDGIPIARPIDLPFGGSAKLFPNHEERLVWDLAKILFDDYNDKFSEGIPAAERTRVAHLIRKDRLATYWSQLCKEDALEAVVHARSVEERAIAYLSMNMVVEACKALSEGKDYRLATLVAQIGGDKTLHDDMTEQIYSWRQLNVLSEISEPIRALYGMLSGEVCECEGKRGALEDRTPTFKISERFGLGWARAFGLRLWYAILDDDPIEAAIEKFHGDLKDKETALPKPWFFEKENYTSLWADPTPNKREDVLWGLLKLYSEHRRGSADTRLSDVISPENVKGNPMDSRLSFELYHALSTICPSHTSYQAADQLAISFASEVESATHWLWAIFALLHLSNGRQRQASLKDLLTRHAAEIDVSDKTTRQIIFETFKVPSAWVYEAKAIYARSVLCDPIAEVHFLQQAGNWAEAHSVLCANVAPHAIVEQDHGTLAKLLAEFETAGETPHEWRMGGGIYADYLALLSASNKGEKQKLTGRLLRTLPDLAGHKKGKHRQKGQPEKTAESEGFLRGVAAREMGWVVGEMVMEDKENTRDHALTLQLPLTREMRRERSRELGLEYYRKVMAAG